MDTSQRCSRELPWSGGARIRFATGKIKFVPITSAWPCNQYDTRLDIMRSMHRWNNEFARRTSELKNMFDDLGKATQGARLKSLSEFASVKAAYANVSTDRHVANYEPLMKTSICTVKLSLSHPDEYTSSSFVICK